MSINSPPEPSTHLNALFKNKIDSKSKSLTKACGDLNAIQDAKELVPIAQIVQDNLDILEGDYKENLLPHLVDWFSGDFFSWFQQPDCERCHERLEPAKCFINIEGNNVENYKCNNTTCNNYTYDFIRHNDPAILLRTRTGRCGEWANCFMLFLRAFDYEARMVLDTTDHVWNEVWSESQERWLHVDPCEGVIDCPLLYELGWNKKLEYCLAFGPFEALDVTRRYSAHYEATKLRRKSCDELWLEQYLNELTSQLLWLVPNDAARDNILTRRNLDKKHLSEIPMGPRLLPDGIKLNGRKTGDLSWRIARGEFSPIFENHVVITMKSCDTSKRIPMVSSDEKPLLFELRYNSLKDSYESSLVDMDRVKWSSLSYLCENLCHKYERDWKTSYISRYESCPSEKTGRIQWRFDLGDFSEWSKLEIQLNGEIYPGTTIKLELKCYAADQLDKPSDQIEICLNKMIIVSSEQFKTKIVMMDLIAELAGGEPNDEVAWQRPQLFRQTRGKNDQEWPLTIRAY